MNTKQIILAGFAVLALSVGTAQAGPCSNTVGKSAQQDAGAGPTAGNTGQTTTTGSATAGQQPATSTMNRATGGGAASSEDAQKQMQGQPTAAQQAQGASLQGRRLIKAAETPVSPKKGPAGMLRRAPCFSSEQTQTQLASSPCGLHQGHPPPELEAIELIYCSVSARGTSHAIRAFASGHYRPPETRGDQCPFL